MIVYPHQISILYKFGEIPYISEGVITVFVF
jgi:hypothetical protein